MKKIFTLLTVILISIMVLQGQDAPPQAFSFKATIVSKTGAIVASKTVAIRLSILKSNTNGISVFTETFLPKTNEYGQVDILIGNGTRVSGNFSTIEWSNDKYFLKIEVDVKGGKDYILMSVTQLLSVPYAMYAKTAGGITGGITETDPVFVSSPANHISTSNLNNWNTVYGWGNHAGLYRPIGYVPAWNEITSNPFSFTSVLNNQILKYNSTSGKWENWTPNFSSGSAETDPVFTAWDKSSGISITSSQVIDFQENVTNNAAVMANSAKNSYPDEDAAKLAGIAPGAEVNVNADWNATEGDAQILNKPAILAGTQAGQMQYWNGTAWITVASGLNSQILKYKNGVPTWSDGNIEDLVIGDAYQGGIIAYILQSGDPGYIAGEIHGLIAAPSDQSTSIRWSNGSPTITGATATALGTGNANTNTIVTNQGEGSYAAQLCADLVLNGYSDWYLPSKNELNKLYLNKNAIGGFANNLYWSSTEDSNYWAWYQDFNLGSQNYFVKGSSYFVRAIRAF